MTRVSNDFSFAITYLNDIIMFSRIVFVYVLNCSMKYFFNLPTTWTHHTQQEHLSHIKYVFEKLRNVPPSIKLSNCHFFKKKIQYLRHILSTRGIRPLPSKTQAINNMHPPKTAKQEHTFLGLIRYYRKFIKIVAKMAKPLTLLTYQKQSLNSHQYII